MCARVGIVLLTVSKMAALMQQSGGTCTSVGTAVQGIAQQPSCKALIYTDVLIEALSVEISARNASDYQVNIVLISPYSWALSNVYIHIKLGL
jgi:hypothetical protein